MFVGLWLTNKPRPLRKTPSLYNLNALFLPPPSPPIIYKAFGLDTNFVFQIRYYLSVGTLNTQVLTT